MPTTLNTQGDNIVKTFGAFENYYVIRYSQDYPNETVTLTLANGGTLDLSHELQGLRCATVYASAAGNTSQVARRTTRSTALPATTS